MRIPPGAEEGLKLEAVLTSLTNAVQYKLNNATFAAKVGLVKMHKAHSRSRIIGASVLAASLTCGAINPAMAGGGGTVFGNGGATEITQVANMLQLGLQYEQQIASYVRQGLQLQADMKNLMQNPMSLLGQDVGNLINDVGALMRGGMAIGSDVAEIDRNFAKTFKGPSSEYWAKSFTRWNQTNTDTLEASLKAIGKHRGQFKKDSDAIEDLFRESQRTEGNLSALQTIAKMNAFQLQQNQKLHDLLLGQNAAASTYMTTQLSKDQKREADLAGLLDPYKADPIEIDKVKAIKWNSILFKK